MTEPRPDLIDNHRGGKHCRYCDDEAMLVVGTHKWQGADYDDLGPCPFCVKGARVEFGIAQTKSGEDEQSLKPPWGKDGFWRGRPPIVRENEPAGKEGAIPDWVHVWGWLRSRGFDLPLPQQIPHVDESKVISMADYESALKSWRQAGSPPVWKTYGGLVPAPTLPSIDDLLGV